ncbi:MAG: ABC transporter permease [Burkholderiaceae bacterium]
MTALLRTRHSIPATAWFGMIVVTFFCVLAVFAPLIAPYGQTEIVGTEFAPWSGKNLLGTDNLGRDMVTRLIFGARNTIGIAIVTTLLAFLVGGALGLIAGTMRGWIDQVLGRLVDVLMAVPSLIFTLLLLSIFGTSMLNMVVIIAAVESTRVFRLARALALGIGVLDYVEAAKLRGEGLWWVIVREILPNASAPLIAEFGLRFCFVFLFVATLSFLGLGIQPPTADWGSMVRENAALITYGDITPLLPAGATALMTVAVNFIVDWMLHRSSGLKD